jgi:hypothetical protein
VVAERILGGLYNALPGPDGPSCRGLTADPVGGIKGGQPDPSCGTKQIKYLDFILE